MSSVKYLNQKRTKPFDSDYDNSLNQFEITLPEISLINCTSDEIKSLKINDLNDSWNQYNKKPKKTPLSNGKFEIKKNFSTKLPLYKPIKKLYLLEKIRTDKELSKQEKDLIHHCLEMKNYSIEEIIEMNKLKGVSFKKFNIVLDIDLTLIKAVELNEINFPKKDSDIQVKGYITNNISFEYYCRYRPYLFQFIDGIKKYFNFYVSTLGHSNYASKIINDFTQKTNINIPQRNIVSNFSENILVKNIYDISPLKDDIKELNNTIIIDDTVNFWIKPPNRTKDEKDIEQCIRCLIPSKRYVIYSAIGNDRQKYGILIHNEIYEEQYNKNKNYSIDVDFSYCIEKDSDSEKNKYGQFYYLEKYVKNCIKFSLFSGIPLVNAMEYYRKKVFEDCKFNLKYLENEWNYCISNMVKELGGNIVINIDETTHFITANEINMNKIKQKNNQIFVNINYIFQCYFNFKRMSEFENQFKAKPL